MCYWLEIAHNPEVVGSKRSPAMNPWRQNPDPFFSSKSQLRLRLQGVYQILDETFVEGAEYTLSVWLGIAWDGYEDQWSLYFTGEDYANNLSEASGSAPVGSWQQVSLVYTATNADAGKKIGIKMTGAIYVTFEDVTLFYSSDE